LSICSPQWLRAHNVNKLKAQALYFTNPMTEIIHSKHQEYLVHLAYQRTNSLISLGA